MDLLPLALDDAARSTIILVATFFVAFPALAHGLIVFAAAQAMGEKAQNDAYASGEDVGEPQD